MDVLVLVDRRRHGRPRGHHRLRAVLVAKHPEMAASDFPGHRPIIAVQFFGEAEIWFALIKLIAVGALVVVAIVLVATRFVSPDGDPATIANLWNDGGFFPNGVMGFLGGFQIAFFAFVGIELVGTAAAEMKDPCTTLPKAINAIPVRLALFYVLALLAITTVIPWRKVVPGVSPFVSLFGLAGFGAAASVMNFVLLTAAASSDNSGLYSTSRMMYGLRLDHAGFRPRDDCCRSAVPVQLVPHRRLLHRVPPQEPRPARGVGVQDARRRPDVLGRADIFRDQPRHPRLGSDDANRGAHHADLVRLPPQHAAQGGVALAVIDFWSAEQTRLANQRCSLEAASLDRGS